MPSVVERLGHSYEGQRIVYDERPLSWERADEIAGRRLDRRKNYVVIEGQVCSSIRWTATCSGCDGGGCEECGYHGKVRNGCWMPDDGSEPRRAVGSSPNPDNSTLRNP
jgi:hypothetical protein